MFFFLTYPSFYKNIKQHLIMFDNDYCFFYILQISHFEALTSL